MSALLRVCLGLSLFVLACQPAASGAQEVPGAKGAVVKAADYPWLEAMPQDVSLTTLEARFAPPKGFARVDGQGMTGWLRGLPIREDRQHVLSYRGDMLGSPSAAVVFMDVGQKNVQQCADSAIRLHAEYFWHLGRAKELSYHFTSGDKSTWKAWRRGEFFKIRGAKVTRGRGKARRDTHAEFRRYLDHTFRYAGTRSLRLDSEPVTRGTDLRPGDFFVQPGGPGHAVVLLDVAVHPDGRRVGLVGQGFMPAQEFHVVKARGAHVMDGVWFVLPQKKGDVLDTPSWQAFSLEDSRRFKP